MKIQVRERQIAQQTSTMNGPKYQGPMREAFGEDLAQAQQRLGNTVQQVGQQASAMITRQQERDDEQAVIEASTSFMKEMSDNLRNQEQDENGVSKGILNRTLGNARGASLQFEENYKEMRERYLNGVVSENQKRALLNRMDSHFVSEMEQVRGHESRQLDADYKNTIDTNLKEYVNKAASIREPGELYARIMEAQLVNAKAHGRLGVDGKTSAMQNQALAADMVKASVMASIEDNPQGARTILESVKDRLGGVDYEGLKKSIDGKMMTEEMAATWKGVAGMRMSDGNVDLAKAQKLVESMPMTAEKKEKYFDYIKGKASEDMYMRNAHDDANTRQFMNTLISQQGQGLDNALKLAASFGKDPYEKSQFEDVAKKLFDKPITEDQNAKIAMWESIKDGSASKQGIDDLHRLGKISASTWYGFRQDYFESQQPGGAKNKEAMERVELLAKEEFNDPKKRAQFMYTMSEKIKQNKMDPDQAFKYAKEQLESAPGMFGGEVWKNTLKQSDDEKQAWGTIKSELGDDVVFGIAKGALLSGKPTAGVDDIENFANSLGGYSEIKQGTPKGEAINWLVKNGKPVTLDNVEYVLKAKGYTNAITRQSATELFGRFTDTSSITNSGSGSAIASK